MINMKVSVIIPVYNEQTSLLFTYHKVKETNLVDEILFVDDGSRDMSPSILASIQDPLVKVYTHETNRGKGAAIRTGLQYAHGDILLIQDADLEYDPRDYPVLFEPFLSQQAQVVYGSRFLEGTPEGILFWNKLANRFLTFITNLLFGVHLSDMETGYKAFQHDVIPQLDLQSDGFEIEPEITALLLKMKIPIVEVPIRFHPRKYQQGKKIRPRDAFIALWTLLKFRFNRN